MSRRRKFETESPPPSPFIVLFRHSTLPSALLCLIIFYRRKGPLAPFPRRDRKVEFCVTTTHSSHSPLLGMMRERKKTSSISGSFQCFILVIVPRLQQLEGITCTNRTQEYSRTKYAALTPSNPYSSPKETNDFNLVSLPFYHRSIIATPFSRGRGGSGEYKTPSNKQTIQEGIHELSYTLPPPLPPHLPHETTPGPATRRSTCPSRRSAPHVRTARRVASAARTS